MLFLVYRVSGLLAILLSGQLPAQQLPVFRLKPTQIFPTLGYGPHEWSLLRLTNPARFVKTARIDVYRGNGEIMQADHVVSVAPGQSADIRIEKSTTEEDWCWARLEDVSTNKAGQPLEVSARVERVTGNVLEDFPQNAVSPERRSQWLSPASAVSNRQLFFLNMSEAAAVLEICSANAYPKCSAESAASLRTVVKPRGAVVIRVGNVLRPALLIQSTRVVLSVVGLLRPETPSAREYSAESSITFDEPAQK